MVAAMKKINKSPGKANRISTRRMIRVSTQPLKYPAKVPKGIPRASVTRVTMMEMKAAERAPQMMRLKRSRPTSSVPRG